MQVTAPQNSRPEMESDKDICDEKSHLPANQVSISCLAPVNINKHLIPLVTPPYLFNNLH